MEIRISGKYEFSYQLDIELLGFLEMFHLFELALIINVALINVCSECCIPDLYSHMGILRESVDNPPLT